MSNKHPIIFCTIFILAIIGACTQELNVKSDAHDKWAITEQAWGDDPIQTILDRQAASSLELQIFISEHAHTVDIQTGTYVGLVQLYGPQEVRDTNNGFQLLLDACDKGQMRACRSIGRRMVGASDLEIHNAGKALLSEACTEGISLSCQDLTFLYRDSALEKDPDLALNYAEKTCDLTSSFVCGAAAYAVRYDNLEPSRHLLQMNCDRGELTSCAFLSRTLLEQDLPDHDYARAMQVSEQACLADHASSCEQVFYMLETLKAEAQDVSSLQNTSEQLCFNGHARMCYRLVRHINGPAGSDPQRTFPIKRQGCKLGNEHVCRWLADAYLEGLGVEADKSKAIEVHEHLCETGSQGAKNISCRELMTLSDENIMLSKAEQDEKICRSGEYITCRMLAWDYAYGQTVEKDKEKSLELFEYGCSNNDPFSCMDIATLYSYPKHGFELDMNKAEQYRVRACNLGSLGCVS